MHSEAERGQTLLVACLTVLILSLATMATVNIGHAIHERIRLQDAADSAAYSTAAMEARAFNFYAFANRAQASHYVSAMAWQSLDSFIYFAEAFLTDFYGFLRTVDVCGGTLSVPWTSICPMLVALPGVGALIPIVHALLVVVGEVLKGYQALLAQTDPDRIIGREIVPAHWALNSLMAAASSAMMQSALAQAQAVSPQIVAANDTDAVASAPGSAVSRCLFERAHYQETLGAPSAPRGVNRPLDPDAIKDDEKVARAKRVMGAIANGSRYSCDGDSPCPSAFITQRDDPSVVPFGWLLRHPGGPPDTGKLGQTRMLTTKFANGQGKRRRSENYLRDWRDPPGYGIGALAQADNLGSDDLYWMNIGPLACSPNTNRPGRCWGDPRKGRQERADHAMDQPYHYMVKTSIWALNQSEGIPGGLHWRVEQTDGCLGPECGLGVTLGPGAKGIQIYTANIRPMRDGNHDWQGTAPFPHFEPGQYATDCSSEASAPDAGRAASQAEEFNQPSAWVTLTQTLPKPLLGVADPAVLNAMARAQTYYHRPGNWAEQPNFFNPYWRPRLASVYQGRAAMPLDGFLPGVALQRVFTH